MNVWIERCSSYRAEDVGKALEVWRTLFARHIQPGARVLLKPNWIAPSHKHRPEEWESVITHPVVITAVLEMVLDCLDGNGAVVIADAPQTDSSWQAIMGRMLPQYWVELGRKRSVPVSVVDLRDHEWDTRGDVNVGRRSLPGDPAGSTICDLKEVSEFVGHRPSAHGYYGADYDKRETNEAHSNGHHRYKVSRSAIAADVFVNLPKLKTHKKAGITCSLKNLVGINTYKNWLPHHSEGTPEEGGDQFPAASAKNTAERMAVDWFKAVLVRHPAAGRLMIPVKALGKRVFGSTQQTIRNGAWYGNDTLWRMVLDLNKVLLYANPDGTLRPDQPSARKPYISVVDAVIAGEGNGPEAPEPKSVGLLVAGDNPVAVDLACARLMGFDWQRIPSLQRSLEITQYRLADLRNPAEVVVRSLDPRLDGPLAELPADLFSFLPHFGWVGHVESQ